MSLIPDNFGRRIRQTRFNPLRSLTPQSLATALDSFDAGWLRAAALLWEQILDRDDVLAIAAPKRCQAVSRRPWEIVPQDHNDTTAKRHAEVLTEFWRAIRTTNAADENQRGGLRLLVRQMMLARFHGYAAHEVVMQPGAGLRAVFRFVPLYFFENVTGRLRYTSPEGAVAEGSELPEDAWLITASDTALMKAASVCYLFKRLSLQDWLNFSEKFGIPGIHGETQATKDSTEWNDFVAALDDFASDWVTATNAGAKINLIETKTTGDAPFSPMVERMDRRLAALCRGADLSTISGDNRESGASLQGEEGDLLIEDDCEFITEALEPISRRVIAWTFGEGVEPLARLVIQPPKPKDTALDLKIDEFLQKNKVPQAIADIMERYGRSLPAPGAELLAAPAEESEPDGQKPPVVPIGEDEPKEDEARPAENDRDAKRDAFLAIARDFVARAQAEDLRPLREAVADLVNATPAEFVRRLTALRRDLPSLTPATLKATRTTAALGDVLAAALANGLTEA